MIIKFGSHNNMIYCLVKFGPQSKRGKEKAENIVADYLSSLLNNWQIIDRYYLTWMGGILHSHIFLSRPDSLNRKFHSEWGKKNIEKVAAYFNRKPEWTIKDDDIKKAVCALGVIGEYRAKK